MMDIRCLLHIILLSTYWIRLKYLLSLIKKQVRKRVLDRDHLAQEIVFHQSFHLQVNSRFKKFECERIVIKKR